MQHRQTLRRTLTASTASIAIALTAGLAAPAIAQEAEEDDVSVQDTIVVTARFREESIQDIGASLEALDDKALTDRGVTDVNDLARTVAGVNNIKGAANNNDIAIRGLSNARGANASFFTTSTLYSVFYDDVPVSTVNFGQRDFSFFDLNRVEVIRGPQPTLFGEGSVGGTLRYFSQDPDLDGPTVTGVARARYEDIARGGTAQSIENSTSLILVPGKLGVRVTGFYKDDGGFIDNLASGRKDDNDFESTGGRIVVLAKPNDDLEMRFFAYIARDDIFGSNRIDIGSDPENPGFSASAITDESVDNYDLYGGRISYDFGPVEVTSITGHFNRERESLRFSADGLFFDPFFDTLSLQTFTRDDVSEESFSQEFRFVSNFDGPLNFTAGLFYQDREFPTFFDVFDENFDLVTTPPTDSLAVSLIESTAEEYSAFVEFTYDVNDRTRLIGGVRYVDETVNSTLARDDVIDVSAIFGGLGPFNEGNPIGVADSTAILAATGIGTDFEFAVDQFLPRVGIEFDADENTLLYANAAVGVRTGGLNQPISAFTAASVLGAEQGIDLATDPAGFGEIFSETIRYDSDEVLSIDAGVKRTWLGGDLITNLGLFYTEYEDTQVQAVVGAGIVQNGPDQQLIGLEFEGQYTVNDYLSTYLNLALIDAEFTEDFPAIPGLVEGNSPINVPDLTFSTGYSFEYPIGDGDLSVISNGYFNYTDSRFSSVDNVDFAELDSLEDLGLSVGVQNETFTLSAFIRNALNDRESISVFTGNQGPGTTPFPLQEAVNRPRSAGVELTVRY